MRHPLVYSGPGTYQPHITSTGVVWERNTDGDPLLGVQVDSIGNVRKFAELVRIDSFEAETQEQERW